MTEQEKLKELTRLVCKWNRAEITSDALAQKIWVLYNEEILETWNDPLERLLVNN